MSSSSAMRTVCLKQDRKKSPRSLRKSLSTRKFGQCLPAMCMNPKSSLHRFSICRELKTPWLYAYIRIETICRGAYARWPRRLYRASTSEVSNCSNKSRYTKQSWSSGSRSKTLLGKSLALGVIRRVVLEGRHPTPSRQQGSNDITKDMRGVPVLGQPPRAVHACDLDREQGYGQFARHSFCGIDAEFLHRCE